MNGIQFYLAQDVSLVNGHAIYLDSPWALTSISQRQFWTNVDFSQLADGTVRGILSMDISEWQAAGMVYGKSAQERTAEQIKEEVWTQLKQHLNVGGAAPIADSNLVSWFLDPDIEFPNPSIATNAEPLLINTAGSLQYRPEAQVELQNLFVASDYAYLHGFRLHGGGQRSCAPSGELSSFRRFDRPRGSTMAVGGAGIPQTTSGGRSDSVRVESAASFGLWLLGRRRE